MRLVRDPEVRHGAHPKTAKPLARGLVASILATFALSKMTDAVHTLERHGLKLRLRIWARGAESDVWISPAYYEMTIARAVALVARAALHRRKRVIDARPVIPTARVVVRSEPRA